jgi:hypothetical protein
LGKQLEAMSDRDPKFFSATKVLQWINSTLGLSLTKIEQACRIPLIASGSLLSTETSTFQRVLFLFVWCPNLNRRRPETPKRGLSSGHILGEVVMRCTRLSSFLLDKAWGLGSYLAWCSQPLLRASLFCSADCFRGRGLSNAGCGSPWCSTDAQGALLLCYTSQLPLWATLTKCTCDPT